MFDFELLSLMASRIFQHPCCHSCDKQMEKTVAMPTADPVYGHVCGLKCLQDKTDGLIYKGGNSSASAVELTHWGRVTHICVSKLTIIDSDNGLSPGRRQAIIWTNAGILLIWPLGTNFSEISIDIQTFSLKKIHFKMSSGKWRPFCLGLNVLTDCGLTDMADTLRTRFPNVVSWEIFFLF